MLIRTPESWPPALAAAVAMLALASLDLLGAVAAKEAVERRSAGFAVAGALVFVVLFWVYASSLQYADLAVVTLGWVVVLQIGVVLVDVLRYDAPAPARTWVVVGVLVAAQAYLLLGASGPAGEAPAGSQAVHSAATPPG
ncbi:hypothetical protein [Kineosporia sp. A_224]|uniref:hypothetical protein n=1 Tax=Kineosporia sp. A_224 TaxID=1962180 RepID=UPI000B4A8E8D|nr:hypothetical protein [Kineosporia sp. A_224]